MDQTGGMEVAGGTMDAIIPIPRKCIIWRGSMPDDAFIDLVWAGFFSNDGDSSRIPLALVTPTEAPHIQAVVKYAKREGRKVSVRSGGYSWSANDVRDDALLIDMKRFNSINLSLRSETVYCGPAVTSRQLNRFLATVGRFFPGAHHPDVALGGCLLQGGMGWNCRGWGWACQNVSKIELVTPDGDLKTAYGSDRFLRMARGAGPAFPGVVFQFSLRLPNVDFITRHCYRYPVSLAREILDWAADSSKKLGSETDIVCYRYDTPTTSTETHHEPTSPEIIVEFTSFNSKRRPYSRAQVNPKVEADLRLLKKEHEERSRRDNVEYAYRREHGSVLHPPEGFDLYGPHRHCFPKEPRLNYLVENTFFKEEEKDEVFYKLQCAFTTRHRNSIAIYRPLVCQSRSPGPVPLFIDGDHYFAMYSGWQNSQDQNMVKHWINSTMMPIRGITRQGMYLGDTCFQKAGYRFWSEIMWPELHTTLKWRDPDSMFWWFIQSFLERKE